MAHAKTHTAGSTSVVFVGHSKDYLTELVASVAAASPQHHSVDQLADFVVNLAAVPSTVVVSVVEYSAIDEWSPVLVSTASKQIFEVARVMIAQSVVRNSIDYVD